MTRVILVRHGQTEWNRVERFRGQIDVPLNQTGLWQAEQVGKSIQRRFTLSAIYSGPLSRTLRTAEAIGRASGMPVQALPAANDFSYGEWEGKTPEEVAVAYPKLYELWLTQPDAVSIPGGESLAQLRERIAEAVEQIAAEHPTGNVVVVTHRMVCKVLACYLLGLENSHLWRLDLDTGSISLFDKRDSGWVTLLLNDTCHLEANPAG